MAANLSGMFAQMNNAIQGAAVDPGLLDMASQKLGGLMGDQMGVDRMKFMNQGAQEMESQDVAAAALTSNDPKAMEAAASALMQAGKVQEANAMMERARALGAKQVALLEAGQEEIMGDIEKKKKARAKAQAAAYAVNQGDKDMANLIKSDALSPEAYLATKMKEKELYELSKGEALVDKDGNLIHLNQDLTASGRNRDPGEITANINIWRDAQTAAEEAAVESSTIRTTIGQLRQAGDIGAGFGQSAEDWALKALGKQGEPQYLRTKVDRIINHNAIKSLPPGPASDRDVKIVQGGFPDPKTASKEHLVRYLESAERLAQRVESYNRMKGQYAITGNHAAFDDAWQQHMANENYKTAVSMVRQTDIENLLKYANNPKALAAFERKYPDINPEIFINAAAKSASQ